MVYNAFLYSKIRGREYESLAGLVDSIKYWLYRNGIFSEYCREQIQSHRDNNASVYVMAERGEEQIIGIVGKPSRYFGKEHPLAWDRYKGETQGGRPRPFFLGYVAPKGTPVPSLADLEHMPDLIQVDLEQMFAEAERVYPYYEKGRTFERVLPCSNTYSNNVWDIAAQKLNRGESLGGMVQFIEGKESLFTPITPPIVDSIAQDVSAAACNVGKTVPEFLERLMQKCPEVVRAKVVRAKVVRAKVVRAKVVRVFKKVKERVLGASIDPKKHQE